MYAPLFYLSSSLIIVATLLPLIRKDDWWIRIFDFPRLQIVIAGLITAVLFFPAVQPEGTTGGIFLLLLILAVLYQVWRIYPYTRLAPLQVISSSPEGRGSRPRFRLLIANVYLKNCRPKRFCQLIEKYEPDVVLAVEPDGWWEEQLRVLEEKYPFSVKHPLDNTYGMLLYSRLELLDPQVHFLMSPQVPSIMAEIRLRSDDRLHFYALHPVPPHPTKRQDSSQRDAELMLVGRRIAGRKHPAIVAGDLNDVAWSYTTTLFQKTSRMLDPRRGRGMFNTYHAKYPFLRYPLDHIFHSDHFQLVRLERLPQFGSDHFPIFIDLIYAPEGRRKQEAPLLDNEERKQSGRELREGLSMMAHSLADLG